MGEFTSPIGTGQWMLESYTENEEFVLVTNPNYWGEQPKISKITFKVIPDGQARVMALQSGEVDLIGGDLLGKIPMEGLQELKNSGYRIEELDTMCSYFMAFNQENENFQDVKVRQALNYAIDKRNHGGKLVLWVLEKLHADYTIQITFRMLLKIIVPVIHII